MPSRFMRRRHSVLQRGDALAIEVHRHLSDVMEQRLRRHLPNLSMDFASELRMMQVLQENYDQFCGKT